MTTTLRKPLAPGESRLRINPQQQRIAQHLVKIASERPHIFGGISEGGFETKGYRQLCNALLVKLQNSGDHVITKVQREFLHSVLDDAAANPEPYGGQKQSSFIRDYVGQLQDALPPRGAGTY